jgi:HD-GYP domain-containing protein (c-di-GMP phosphodiesterase class II)
MDENTPGKTWIYSLKQLIVSWFKPSQIKLPIRTKITLPYFFLAILLAVSASILVTNIVFDTVEERYRNQLGEVGQLSQEQMVFEEDKLLETLRLLTNSESVITAFEERDPEKLREEALGIAINQQADAVEFLDENGNLILSMRHREGGGIEDYTFTTGGDNTQFQGWDFVKKVMENQDDLLGDKFSGFVETDWGDFFYVSGAAYQPDTQFKGIVLIGIGLENLTQRIHANVLGQITFYDMDGRVIASSHPFDPEPLAKDFSKTVLTTQEEEISKTRSFEEARDITVGNLSYTEVFGPWEVRGDVDLGILGASLQREFQVTPLPTTRGQVILVFTIAFFLVILIGFNLANLITRPLRKLVQASTSVAEGDLNVQVDLVSNDEIATLANSFNQMVTSLNQSRADILEAYDSALDGWTKALELRDKETEGHTQRVTEMTVAVAKEFDFSEDELLYIRWGAMLHDIGKMGIPDQILHKPGKLSDDEWLIMKKHPLYAYNMLKEIRFLDLATDIPRYHHEHWNGKGYPYGLQGEDIPLPARIFAVVDCWDALTNDRPYRKKSLPEEALHIIQSSAGKLYDPNIVEFFQKFIEHALEPLPLEIKTDEITS